MLNFAKAENYPDIKFIQLLKFQVHIYNAAGEMKMIIGRQWNVG